MIGLSLSICVAQIISGQVNIDDVKKIVTSTKAPDEQTWNKVISDYRRLCWSDNPDEGERVARRLIAEGKIEQPRLTIGKMPDKYGPKGPRVWVESESEIVYH